MSPVLAEDTYGEVKDRMEQIPENYARPKLVEMSMGTTVDLQFVLRQLTKYKSAPLWKLYVGAKRFYASKPISVKIYRNGDLFFAENENLFVCGTGAASQDALEDLCLHIIYFFEYYKKMDRDRLTGDALRLKDLYKNLLIEQ